MEIRFKATKRKHNSGYAEIDKSGDLQFDQDSSKDIISIYVKDVGKISIDCDYKTKTFRLFCNDNILQRRSI